MAISVIDKFNSVIQPLGAGETFLGEYVDIKAEGNVSVLINGNVPAPGTLSFEFSIDKTIVDSKEDFVIADITDTLAFTRLVAGSFFRVRYVNGATPLATFRLQTQKNKGKNVGFAIEEFQAVLEAIEINTSITANETNVITLAKAEISSVPAGIETFVVGYTTAALKATWITRISCSGQENSKWRYFQALDPKVVRRIGLGQANVDFDFGNPGLKIPAGGVLTELKVTHPFTGRTPDFEASIFGYEEL